MWPNQQETANLVTFTEEILNWKLYFLCSGVSVNELSFNPNSLVTTEANDLLKTRKMFSLVLYIGVTT